MSAGGKVGIVYVVMNTRNEKLYFGQTSTGLRTRWSKHLSAARRGKVGRLAAAIRKYGHESFAICELLRGVCGQDLDETEAWFIAFHESANPEFGYNIAEGGMKINRMTGDANPSSRLDSAERETRGRAIAEGLKRRKEQGLPLGAKVGNRNHPFPLGNKLGCFPKSEEHRSKISEARKRYWERVRAG